MNKKCKDTLKITPPPQKKRKIEELCLGGKPHCKSHEMTLLASKKRNTLPNGTVPFYVTFCALSASWSRVAAVSWWRRGAAVVRQQYFNGSKDLWMVCHRGETTWANPQTIVASIWMETVTQVLISLHLNLCCTPSVYRSRRPLESPLAKMWHVYQCLFLHTVTHRHINTDAHANTNTQCLCVSLSSQIREHDIIFLVCLCTCAHVLSYTNTHTCMCVSPWACTHLSTHCVCSQNANVVSVLMTFSSLLMPDVFFLNIELISWVV